MGKVQEFLFIVADRAGNSVDVVAEIIKGFGVVFLYFAHVHFDTIREAPAFLVVLWETEHIEQRGWVHASMRVKPTAVLGLVDVGA